MAYVVGFLMSGRKNGYTAQFFKRATDVLQNKGIEVEEVYLHDYNLKPCKSCFYCIRDNSHTCVLDDDFGKRGEGILYNKILKADGIFVADPVHSFDASAICHLFFERCYQFMWSGITRGVPLAAISCASNQGMETIAQREICKLAFSRRFKYIGGVAAHVYRINEVEQEIDVLFEQLGDNVLLDSQFGRQPFTEEARFIHFSSQPWDAFENIIAYLTKGTGNPDESRIKTALSLSAGWHNQEVTELLKEAQRELTLALVETEKGQRETASEHLAKATGYWANATWKQFLGRATGMVSPPKTYKPLSDE